MSRGLRESESLISSTFFLDTPIPFITTSFWPDCNLKALEALMDNLINSTL